MNILNIGRRYDLNKIAEVICAVVLFSLYKSRAYCLNLSFFDLTFWYIKITIDAIIVTIVYVSLSKFVVSVAIAFFLKEFLIRFFNSQYLLINIS